MSVDCTLVCERMNLYCLFNDIDNKHDYFHIQIPQYLHTFTYLAGVFSHTLTTLVWLMSALCLTVEHVWGMDIPEFEYVSTTVFGVISPCL